MSFPYKDAALEAMVSGLVRNLGNFDLNLQVRGPKALWRRGWDSNPRGRFRDPLALQASALSQLGDLSFCHRTPAERVGFEPTGLSPNCFQDSRLKPLGHLSAHGAPGRTRTADLVVRNHTLYPLSYRRTLQRAQGPRRRGERDSNPRRKFLKLPQPLSRRPHSASLASPPSSCGGEGGIRTHGAFAQLFSRQPP